MFCSIILLFIRILKGGVLSYHIIFAIQKSLNCWRANKV